MPNFLSKLTKGEQARLLEELNYVNLEEIRGFCVARGIPYKIVVEYSSSKIKATMDTDRKPIVLARVRRYLQQAMSVGRRAFLRESCERRNRQRGLDLATVSTIAGAPRSTREPSDCFATSPRAGSRTAPSPVWSRWPSGRADERRRSRSSRKRG
jgi:hypothetical protein